MRDSGRSLLPVVACTCVVCAIEAGCGADERAEVVQAKRSALERQFRAANTAYDLNFQQVRRLNGDNV